MEPSPYLFVVGSERSGTTLLQRMLDHHPQLAVVNEARFLPQAPGVEQGIDPSLTPELVDWIIGSPRFSQLDLPEGLVHEMALKADTYAALVSALFREYGRLRGKPLAGEKNPRYVHYLPLLHSLFPRVRTIHIIRDGRDVALSTLQWAHQERGPGRLALWRQEPVAVCALWWAWQVGRARRDGARLGPARYREVRYEQLVDRPEAALRDLGAFLELPYAPEMLTYHKGRTRVEPGLSTKRAWLPPTAGLRDWRTSMAERDLALFEALAGDLLSVLGYPRGIDEVSPDIMAVARRCRQWWEPEMAQREERKQWPFGPA